MPVAAKLTSKRWWYLIPIIFITYSLAYLDRANYSFAAAAGIEKDLAISNSVSSLIGAIFFLGYFIFQLPGAIYAAERSVRKLIFCSLILWGCCATATGLVNSIPVLMVIRFILGAVEAAVMPAMLIYISNWFTQDERSRANTFLILGNPVTVLWMSVVSGYLINLYGWREMFIFEGIPALIWAICWWLWVRDKPEEVNWLSQDEKRVLKQKLAAEQKNLPPLANYNEAFRSKNVLLLCLVHAFWSIGVYGFVMWMPSILKQATTIDMISVGWLTAVPYLAAVITMLLVSWLSDKYQIRSLVVWPLLLIASITFFASWLLGRDHFWPSYGLLTLAGACMYAPYGPFFAQIPELMPKNAVGFAMGLVNGAGALGGFAGAWLVGYLNGVTGQPNASYCFMSAALLFSVIIMLQVKSRDKTDASGSY